MRKAGALTISDRCARGEQEDVSGAVLAERLAASGYDVAARAVVPDDAELVAGTLLSWCDAGCDLILTTGGTGFSPRDIAPEATRRVIERDAPGLAEMLRSEGYRTTPRAVLSRGVAGIRGRTLIVNLPGSPAAVRQESDLLLPLLHHALAVLNDEPTDHSAPPLLGQEESAERRVPDPGPGITAAPHPHEQTAPPSPVGKGAGGLGSPVGKGAGGLGSPVGKGAGGLGRHVRYRRRRPAASRQVIRDSTNSALRTAA